MRIYGDFLHENILRSDPHKHDEFDVRFDALRDLYKVIVRSEQSSGKSPYVRAVL